MELGLHLACERLHQLERCDRQQDRPEASHRLGVVADRDTVACGVAVGPEADGLLVPQPAMSAAVTAARGRTALRAGIVGLLIKCGGSAV